MTLLSLQNISKVYNSNVGNFEVFKEINFEINENEKMMQILLTDSSQICWLHSKFFFPQQQVALLFASLTALLELVGMGLHFAQPSSA